MGDQQSVSLDCPAVPDADTAWPSARHILELGYAFRKSRALLSALELDLFTLLADGPLHLEQIAFRAGMHCRGAEDFLDALVSLDLLERDDEDRYRNHAAASFYLDRRRPTYIGGPLEQINARLYEHWGQLTQALRSGSPVSALGTNGYQQFYQGPGALELFLKAMSGGSLIAAHELANKFFWRNYRTFIDIGTAEGCLPAAIANAHPHLTGGGFDLPEVEATFNTYVRAKGLSDRLRFHGGNFLSDALPEADVIIMGRILHNWDLATRKRLIEKAHLALLPGGALVIYDAMIHDARTGPDHSLLASLNMLIETASGSEYTIEDCIGWMRAAGFVEPNSFPLGALHTAVFATKQGNLIG
jgi:hypothetical protein